MAAALTQRKAPPASAPVPVPVKAAYVPNPPSHHYEFGGPLGALSVTLAVPFFTYWLTFACTPESGCPPWPVSSFLSFHQLGWAAMVGDAQWWSLFWSAEAAAVYVGWYTFCVLCWRFLPGERVQGSELRNGEKITYPMNGTCGPSVPSR